MTEMLEPEVSAATARKTVSWFVIACAGLVAVRMTMGAHAPAAVDAHVCLAALALGLVPRAPRVALACAGLVVGSAVLSIAVSWDRWISLLALPAILGPAAFFVLASSGSCRRALLAGLAVGGVVNAGAALVQRFYTWPDALRRMDELGLDASTVGRLAEARPLGLTVSPDLAGGLCMAGLFGAAALALDIDDKRKRAALVAAAAIAASGLLVVRSFGTGVALVAGIGVSAVLLARMRSGRAALVVGGGGIGAGAVALAVTIAVRGTASLGGSLDERVENWRAAVDAFAAHPLLGVGFMRFPAAYLAERAPGSNLTRYAHSAPLQLLAETGVVGGILVVVAVALFLRAVWSRRQALRPRDAVIAGAAVALAARTAIDYDAQVAQTASIIAVVWGLLLSVVSDADERSAPVAPPPQRRLMAVLAAGSFVLVLLLVWRQGALEAAQETHDESPLVAYSSVIPFDVEPRLARGALAVDALSVCTNDESCAAAQARVFDALDPVCARAHPPSAAFMLRARARLVLQDLDGALTDVDTALRLDPGNVGAHQMGIAIVRAQQKDDAARLQAASTWGVPPPG